MAQRPGKVTPIEPGLIARITGAARLLFTGKTSGGVIMPDAVPPVVTGPDWFGPGEPILPMAPPEAVVGRQFNYPVAYNIAAKPRKDEPVTFAQMRALADNAPVLRLVIETRKDQLAPLEWAIQAKDKTKTDKAAIKQITDFLTYPDREHDWETWLRMICEDMLVIDAATLYPRTTMGGQLYALEPVAGDTIFRVLDEYGRTPAPPAPAFQQVLHGVPAADYTRDQLLYLPRNVRTNRVYGYSPVEQIIMTINILIRRDLTRLHHYSEGTVPDALAGVPDGWNAEQIEQFQRYFDAMLEDNSAQRSKLRFVPESIAKAFIQTKEALLKDEFDEWLARIICYAFSVSAQWAIKQMNRSTSETSQDQAYKEGLIPLQSWVRRSMNRIITQYFNRPDLEFVWAEEDVTSPEVQAQILTTYQSKGIYTINEIRGKLGEDPIPNGNDYLIYTATGAVTLEDVLDPPDPPPMLGHNGGPTLDGPEGENGVSSHDHDHPDAPKGRGRPPNLAKAAGQDARVTKSRKRIERQMRRFLAREGKQTAARVGAAVAKLTKADGDGDPESEDDAGREKAAQKIANQGIDPKAWNAQIDPLAATLKNLSATGVEEGIDLLDLGKDEVADLTQLANPRAEAWASQYAAERVGQLADTTREQLRALILTSQKEGWSIPQLQKAIQESYGFSANRAFTIAQYETLKALNAGNLTGWKASRDKLGLKLGKKWRVSTLENHCPACNANEMEGPIGLDESFSSGQDHAPAHPHCTCDTIVVTNYEPEVKKSFNPAQARDAHGRWVAGPADRGGGGKAPTAMPHDIVGNTLGRKLAPGGIVMSPTALKHQADDHPEDTRKVAAAVRAGLHRVEYVGVPKRGGGGMNSALYLPVPNHQGEWAVLPVGLDRNAHGNYEVRSGYVVMQAKVASRVAKGDIVKVKK